MYIHLTHCCSTKRPKTFPSNWCGLQITHIESAQSRDIGNRRIDLQLLSLVFQEH